VLTYSLKALVGIMRDNELEERVIKMEMLIEEQRSK
jgi:hypothetical protein